MGCCRCLCLGGRCRWSAAVENGRGKAQNEQRRKEQHSRAESGCGAGVRNRLASRLPGWQLESGRGNWIQLGKAIRRGYRAGSVGTEQCGQCGLASTGMGPTGRSALILSSDRTD